VKNKSHQVSPSLIAWRFLFSERGVTLVNKFEVKRICDSEVRPLEWWIEGLVPKESFCLLAGEGGAGKSSYIVFLAEQLVKQGLTVLFITTEGNGGASYRRRMSDLNALYDNLLWLDLNTEINSDYDMPTLKELGDIIEENKVDVLFIDPVTMFAKGDTSKWYQVRGLLTPFDRLSTSKKMTIIGLAHFNKPGEKARKVKYCVTGSVEWINVPRLVYCLGKKDDYLSYVILAKANDTKDERAWAVEYRPNKLARAATGVTECDYDTADEELSSKTSNYESKKTPPDIILRLAQKYNFKPFSVADVEKLGLSTNTFKTYKDSKWLLKTGEVKSDGRGRPQEMFSVSGLLAEYINDTINKKGDSN